MRTQEPSAASCDGCSMDCSEPAAHEPLGHGCMLDRRLLLAAADPAVPPAPKPDGASAGAPTVLLQLVAASSAACSAAVTLSRGETGGKLLAQS